MFNHLLKSTEQEIDKVRNQKALISCRVSKQVYQLSSLFTLLRRLVVLIVGMMLLPQANAVDIRQQQIDVCIEGTVNYKIADMDTATKLCSCTVGVRSRMTIGQMWEVESYAQSGKDPSTLDYVKSMREELQQCTNGLTLDPPQKLQK